MKWFLILSVALASAPAVFADVVVPTRTIRANAIISEVDVTVADGDIATAFSRIGDVIGQEARIALYAGRPIHVDQIGPPALVNRNQIVDVHFQAGSLSISTEGRALERGGIGDRIRIMNLQSRSMLFGQVQADGTVRVNK